ncbi:uncharacterized protein STEHIDRAFT_95335 [Stereum hirsutum FP-91666 SS1]|uniref:uncharacterized protein n=1 Tax=Stereum hirsutum (strain FP-91666) TaxID=721885 RepID=UPI000440C770|nr:uncharacterized protein STEHIDRAFT_95335 [Stereum hirsutum FP-91666 SS1]EIM88276.1 hypothetical protein STEHIDRAFT_95335 [Stereum hirsutum FP-91666 SS1]
MSRVINVSSKLGEYMLQGWVLTDKSCPKCSIPLMRSPDGRTPQTWFCANCEGNETTHHRTPSNSESVSNSSAHYSRPSTPPTEVSSTLSSPTFAPPIETAESIQRRQQSDFASNEIGKRLLKGWAMLADECPVSTCYGIPLVRPPKSGSDRDPRKECVVCGGMFTTEKDAHGFERLVPGETAPTVSAKRQPSTSASALMVNGSQDKGKAAVRGIASLDAPSSQPTAISSANPLQGSPYSFDTSQATAVPNAFREVLESKPTASSQPVIDATTRSLESALAVLSNRLSCLSGQSIVDPGRIAETAEAIGKVAQALSIVKKVL